MIFFLQHVSFVVGTGMTTEGWEDATRTGVTLQEERYRHGAGEQQRGQAGQG